jgi:D-ribose pyranose/furanose isomerase RbsD
MATYLQNVTDYIPQFQPFQPDLNFYANALQTKQNQYDTNYKALNNVYGQYFYADLTHGDNLKKKDELIKAIDFNLKRVSGLDLSLEQNVDQAKQVFKPFYEDKHLMKDMAWTKSKNSQRNYAEGLKNNRDEKQRAQYWEAGVRSIDYKTEEFKNATLEETMNMSNVSYTPYVNVMEKAQKIAKDAGLSVESVDMSPDGKWIVKTKNGQQLIPKLSHLFEASLGSDPAVIDVYKTQAYVNRKDYAYSNAAQFNGDKNAAEMSYLSESYNMLKAENEARQAKLQSNDKVYSNKTAAIEKAIETNSATPKTNSFLERIQEAKRINDALLATTDGHVASLSEQSGTPSTSTGFQNPYGDIESLRYKVDNAMASRLMQKDLGEAAQVFAYKDAKQDISANPYAVQAEAHKYRMQEVSSANASRERAAAANNASRERAAQMRNNSDKEINMDNELIKTGGYHRDLQQYITGPRDEQILNPSFGRAVKNEGLDDYTTQRKTSGNSSDIINVRDQTSKYTSKEINNNVVPYVTNMLASIRDLESKGKLSADDMKTIFGNTGMTVKKLNEQLKSDPYKLITKTLGTTKLKQITGGFQKVIKVNNNTGMTEFNDVANKMRNYHNGLSDYYNYTNNLQDWKNKTRDAVKAEVVRNVDGKLKTYVKDMYDEKTGQLVSEAEFMKKHKDNNKIQVGAPWSKGNNSVGSTERGKMIKVAGKDIYVTANNIEDVIKLEGKNYVDNNVKTGAQLMEQSKKLGAYSDQSKTSKLDPNKKYIEINDNWKEITSTNKEYFYKKLGKERLTGTYGQLPELDLSKSTASIYSQLKKEIHKAYSSSAIRETPPNLSGITDVRDSGLTTIGQQGIPVFPDLYDSRGAMDWAGFKNDIANLDFEKDVDVRLLGAVASGTNRNKEGKALLQEMFNETALPGSAFKGFRLAAQPLAQNKPGKGAMVVYPDATWLKKHTYTETGEGSTYKRGAGIISAKLASYIAQNGISFIADDTKWNNGLFQSTAITPLESHINYNSEPVTLYDPNDEDKMNSITFKKDDIMGGYACDFRIKTYDPLTGKYIQSEPYAVNGIRSGAELEQLRMNADIKWLKAEEESNGIYRNNQ